MNDYLIIGGGIIGMLTARELVLAGAGVTLVDQQQTGQESSWAGGGIISPLYPWRYADSVTALATWSQAGYKNLSEELTDSTGIDPEWTQNGLLIIAPGDTESAIQWGKFHKQPLESISGEVISHTEPAFASTADSAIWMAGVAQIRNPRLAKALRAEIVKLGVSIMEFTQARRIIITQGKFTRLETNTGKLSADALIVCAGAWTGELLRNQPNPPEITPVRGQMILFKTDPGVISRITLEEDRYIIPRRDGRVLFGSTVEHTGFEKQTTQQALEELREIAISRFPVLSKYPVEKHWAGLRPGSPHGIPYIGRHPEVEGLYANAGHFRNGVVLGPASAALMADLLLDREAIVPPAPYAFDATRN
jgi:glycine oxidase